MSRIVSRFAGEKGPEIITHSTATIRGVMQGVIGVAVIQAILAAIGMVLVGVPAAGLWAALVMILAIIQLPPILVLGPIAAWVFTFADTVPAVIFLVWALLVSGCDGFLKPILMGRGVDAPMLVILIGALGGMMLSGIIGLFVGAVVVAIMYTLFMEWLADEEFSAAVAKTDGTE
jgi:predicted PurR-regulated permease PerM